jgi:hypothetical protein
MKGGTSLASVFLAIPKKRAEHDEHPGLLRETSYNPANIPYHTEQYAEKPAMLAA